jgi:hypothetical protein
LEFIENDVTEIAIDTEIAIGSPCLLNNPSIAFDCFHLWWRRDLLRERFSWGEFVSNVMSVEGLDF